MDDTAVPSRDPLRPQCPQLLTSFTMLFSVSWASSFCLPDMDLLKSGVVRGEGRHGELGTPGGPSAAALEPRRGAAGCPGGVCLAWGVLGLRGRGARPQHPRSPTFLQLLIFLHLSLQLFLDQLGHGGGGTGRLQGGGAGSQATRGPRAPVSGPREVRAVHRPLLQAPRRFLIQDAHRLGNGERARTPRSSSKPDLRLFTLSPLGRLANPEVDGYAGKEAAPEAAS